MSEVRETKHVKDFNGKLIPRNKARNIEGAYYEEGVTCILMPDGRWYRISTDKIRFDWETKTWLFTRETEGFAKGLVDDGSIGWFSPTGENVKINYKKDTFIKHYKFNLFNLNEVEEGGSTQKAWTKTWARTAEVAEKHGYIEAIANGEFYKDQELTGEDRKGLTRPNVPQGERNNTYSLDDDPGVRKSLEVQYHAANFPISKEIHNIAKLIPYSFGLEYESSNGFIPARLRGKMGVRPLRDGSISGIEYVTVPLQGAKGVQNIKNLTSELSKRCVLNLQCSLHIHYGNVRRDKLYILSLWKLCFDLQSELLGYFPFSRTNAIRSDGKVYCKHLPDLGLDTKPLFKIKEKDVFTTAVLQEFNKIYSFLNDKHSVGEVFEKKRIRENQVKILAGKPTNCWRLVEKTYCFSTKNKQHAIRGHKWDRPQRYYWMNLLPTFFSGAETIEFRNHEATLNFEKTIMWMLTCVSILKYAENAKLCLLDKKVTVSEVLHSHLPAPLADHVMAYYQQRKEVFRDSAGRYNKNWDSIENDWIMRDKDYKFNKTSIESL